MVTAAGAELQPGEYELRLVAADPDSTAALPGSNGLIALDTTVTPELSAEGTARDVIRVIQQARKDAGLDVSDRIALTVGADGRGSRSGPHARWSSSPAKRSPLELVIVPAAELTGSAPQPVGDGGEVRRRAFPVLARTSALTRPARHLVRGRPAG